MSDLVELMGTGSRQVILYTKLKEWYKRFEEFILFNFESDIKAGLLTIISGAAEGFDEILATVGYRNGIPVTLYIPTVDYGDYYWRRNSLTSENRWPEWVRLLDRATNVVYLENYLNQKPEFMIRGPHYILGDKKVHANMARNQVMVDVCTMGVVYDSPSPGTRDAVKRLQVANRPYIEYTAA